VNAKLSAYINELPIVDVHEHHMPQILLNKDVGLLRLFEESYAGWTQGRTAPSATAGSGRWSDISAYVEGSGTNAFVGNMATALTELYGLGEGGITESNWAELDSRVREKHADPRWSQHVLDRAGIATAISDPYVDPLMDIRLTLGERYLSVLRINAFAMGWSAESRDHNGNSAWELLARLGIKPGSFDDYLQALAALLDQLAVLHKVGLKNALAYDRSVNFDDLNMEMARNAWGKRDPSPPEKKAFGDVVVERLCQLAGKRDIPVQMHLGSALIRGSRPLEAAGLIERNPQTRFLLMHLAYPWCEELLGMAFTYRNVWIDLTWSWLLSPSRFGGLLEEAIDVLPDESRMMLGGDTWHAEEAYGAIAQARRLICQTLDSCVRQGRFRYRDAERLSRKILFENASKFFSIGQ
jgi:hypothetical protein